MDGTNILTGCTLMNGLAKGGQGGVPTSGGSAGIGGQGYGGGLYAESEVAFLNCTVNSNNATAGTGGGGPGGGVGGGIYNVVDMNLTNCTIANNIAGGSTTDSGGGVHNNGTLAVFNCTIAGNQADFGGGLEGFVTLGNTIVAGNSAGFGPDGSGTIISSDYNLIQNVAGLNFSGATNHTLVGQNPSLGPLQNNGGLTATMALLSGSPAIDQGKNFGTATDQRGLPRPFDVPSIANAGGGDGSDIGAFELLLSPGLNIQRADSTHVVLFWSSDAASFRLESVTNLPAGVWSTVNNPRVIASGQIYVTNPLAAGAQFYRLNYP